MFKIQKIPQVKVYDPALCCSTGVCGPSVDAALPRIAGDLAWLADQGIHVDRYNLAQTPQAFAENEAIARLLNDEGEKALPVTVVNDTIVCRGAYPTREQLSAWCNLIPTPEQAPQSDCCGPKGCC